MKHPSKHGGMPRTEDDDDDLQHNNREVCHGNDGAENPREIIAVGVALSANETVSRFGSANAEFIKGYSGVDKQTGQRFAKGLADIAKHKVNPDPVEAAKNIKQQAGYSAEVAATSHDNAEAIIQGSKVRTSRSDDLSQYGKNHNVVDRVQVLNGEIIEGSQAQMKFVGDRDQLFERIAREDGKFARYRGTKLELPSEQFKGSEYKANALLQQADIELKNGNLKRSEQLRREAEKFKGAEDYCRGKASELRQQADKVQQKGNLEAADKLRQKANNYEQLADNVKDSGLTTEKAIFYREHPEIATALDIAHTSHRAGMEGAKYGAIIGGCISLLQNGLSAAQGQKEMGEAAKGVVVDTAKAGVLGYGTAFVGSAIKGTMQQSAKQTIRTLAETSAPTLVVNICLSLGGSVKRYVMGEISEAQLLTEVGEKGAGMLSSGMMAALGQLVIPVPFVGAAIGGMIGYTLSSLFYQSALEAARGAEISREKLKRTKVIQEAARARIAEEQSKLDAFMCREIPQLQQAKQQLFTSLSTVNQSADTFSAAINQFATLLGKQLEFQSIEEFDTFMSSDRPLML